MPQDASGLTQAAANLNNKFRGLLNKIPTFSPKPDTTWHDQQVKAANDSFKKAAAKPAAPKPKPSTPKAPVAKPSTFKKGGVVQKTGYAKVHKGEKVLTAKQAKAAKRK